MPKIKKILINKFYPGKVGIVAKPEDYLYSSASNFLDKCGLIDIEYYGTRIIDANKTTTYL